MTELSTMVKEWLEKILRTLSQNVQSGIRLVVCSVVRQVLQNLLRKDVFVEVLDAHTAKFLDNDAGAEGVFKSLLPSTLFMAPITTFDGRKR